jgi:hypothetical protein
MFFTSYLVMLRFLSELAKLPPSATQIQEMPKDTDQVVESRKDE